MAEKFRSEEERTEDIGNLSKKLESAEHDPEYKQLMDKLFSIEAAKNAYDLYQRGENAGHASMENRQTANLLEIKNLLTTLVNTASIHGENPAFSDFWSKIKPELDNTVTQIQNQLDAGEIENKETDDPQDTGDPEVIQYHIDHILDEMQKIDSLLS